MERLLLCRVMQLNTSMWQINSYLTLRTGSDDLCRLSLGWSFPCSVLCVMIFVDNVKLRCGLLYLFYMYKISSSSHWIIGTSTGINLEMTRGHGSIVPFVFLYLVWPWRCRACWCFQLWTYMNISAFSYKVINASIHGRVLKMSGLSQVARSLFHTFTIHLSWENYAQCQNKTIKNKFYPSFDLSATCGHVKRVEVLKSGISIYF